MYSRAISLALMAAFSMPALADDPSLVAHYSLDGSGTDNSGNGPAATAWNGAGYTAAGVCGGAASLDGYNDYLSLPVQHLTDATISAWFYQTRDTGTWQRVWDFGSTTGQGAMFLAVEHGRVGNRIGVGIHSVNGANVEDITANVSAGVGTWRHVVVTFDEAGAGTRVYVDGVLTGQGTYSAQSFDDFLNQTWLLGASHWADPSFAGYIDEVRIYDRVLSATEVATRRDADLACADADGDGVRDEADNCPSATNGNQFDGDADGVGDACDTCAYDADNDADEDGICGDIDLCPVDSDAAQLDADGDGNGDVCDDDDDDDGVGDLDDSCPFDANAGQSDQDGDGIGDVCDADSDGDAVIDDIDACLGTPAGEVVLDDGCSVDQTCPCDGGWRNHGAYVRCVVGASEDLLNAGLLSSDEKGAVVSSAAQSTCGK